MFRVCSVCVPRVCLRTAPAAPEACKGLHEAGAGIKYLRPKGKDTEGKGRGGGIVF